MVEPLVPLSFGAELRFWRTSAGFSLTTLAKKTNYSRGHLCKVENGDKAPNQQIARLCDEALRTGGALARHPGAQEAARAGRPRQWAGRAGPDEDGSPSPQGMWALRTGTDGQSVFGTAPEAGLRATVDSLTALTVAPQSAGGWVDPGSVSTYRTTFDEYRRRGQFLGPVDLLPTLLGELHSLTELARRAGPELRPDLFQLSARFAEYLGWMTQELGLAAWTLKFTDRATTLARLGGDDMAAFRLVRLADLALYERDPARTIILSGQALTATEDPRVRGLAAQRLAQGHALANDTGACLRSLDLAQELLQRAPEPARAAQPVVGSDTVADHVAMATGWCLFDLGKPNEAAAILAVEVERLPAGAHRSQARYGIRLARCYAEMGEIDQACATAEPILRRLPSLASATIGVDVRGLAATLRRHLGRASVKRLGPLLAQNRGGRHH